MYKTINQLIRFCIVGFFGALLNQKNIKNKKQNKV